MCASASKLDGSAEHLVIGLEVGVGGAPTDADAGPPKAFSAAELLTRPPALRAALKAAVRNGRYVSLLALLALPAFESTCHVESAEAPPRWKYVHVRKCFGFVYEPTTAAPPITSDDDDDDDDGNADADADGADHAEGAAPVDARVGVPLLTLLFHCVWPAERDAAWYCRCGSFR